MRAAAPQHAAPGQVRCRMLLPLLHARDAAEAKVASIGTVNPQAPGLVNSVAQAVKRLVARALDWHVREQVEFNRAVMGCVQATLEALKESNRSLAAVGTCAPGAGQELKDLRARWSEWRCIGRKRWPIPRSISSQRGRAAGFVSSSPHRDGLALSYGWSSPARRFRGSAGPQ